MHYLWVMEEISTSEEVVVTALYARKKVGAAGYVAQRMEHGGIVIAVVFGAE